jgi:NADH-quinone oxidoreductase subunit N
VISQLSDIAPEGLHFILLLLLFIQSAADHKLTLPRVSSWLPAGAALVLTAAVLVLPSSGVLLAGSYTLDALSQFFKLAIAAGFLALALNASRQPSLARDKRNDYYLFLALSAWGLMLLASTTELMSLYLALELASYSLYVLVPIRDKTRRSAEAGAKYILFGAAATAVSLFGLSFIMVAQHTTHISVLAGRDWTWAGNPVAVAGLTLFLSGMFFKLALFPFHFWCPDVYQGASNETAAYIATLPKLGGIVVLIRLAAFLKPGMAVTDIIAVLGLISMTFGNLCALNQRDVKRMLGFSSVAHAGYIMLGLVTGTAEGLAAAAFYAVAYLIMNLLCFWVVARVAVDGRNVVLEDLNGLYRRAPGLAFALAVGAFALVGLPPTIGFMGKLFLVAAAWNQGYNWLVIALVVNSAIAIYYYLTLVRHAYTEEKAPQESVDISLFSTTGAIVLAVATLLLGILPACLLDKAVWALGM